MKVFVAGATGVIGWRSVRELVRAGHEVTALARSDEKAKLVDDLGGKPVTFDVFDAADVRANAAGHDAVINLLTHIPKLSKAALPGAFSENDRLRTEASAHLSAAALEGGGRYVQESITFPYVDSGNAWITEETPRSTGSFLDSTNAAEAAAQRVTDGGGAGVLLRFSQFYSADSHHTIGAVHAARRGFAEVPGDADGYWTLIFADDAARAVLAALNAPAGIYNVAEDEPMTRREGARALADALARKKKLHTGLASALSRIPSKKLSTMTRSSRVSNEKFKLSTGWAPEVPSQREGWPLILKEMGDE